MSTIAFLGLGAMGSRMARRLMEGGHDLIVWNRTASKADRLVELGAVRAKSPAQAVRAAPTIITMLSDPQALRDVVGGPDGIASGVHTDATMIEMSTVGPAAISRLRSSLPDHVSLLDAPVLGSLSEAESGSLTIFVGGSPALVERWTSLLSTLGTLVPVGELGMGAAAKLLANAALFGGLAMLGEALAFASGLGLPRSTAYSVLEATPLATQAKRRRESIETGRYPVRFPISLAAKDATLIDKAAEDAHVELQLIRSATGWFAQAESLGLGDSDYSAIISAILETSSVPSSATAPGRGSSSVDGLRYDGLVVDLDGVVWRGERMIEGAAQALATIRGKGCRVVFLTNEPGRSRAAFADRLSRAGIPAGVDDVLTSAAATARTVAELDLPNHRAFVVGPPALRDEMAGSGFEIVSDDETAAVGVVVVGAHPGFDYAELSAASKAIRGGARLFATGRDPVFPSTDGLLPGTGAVLAAIETAGGAPGVVVGKPEAIMFELARQSLAGCERIAAVGDDLMADVAGAKRAGLDGILVLTGNSDRAQAEQAEVRPDLILQSLAMLPDAIAGAGG